MTDPSFDLKAASDVLRLQQALQRLTVDAVSASSRQNLIFHILNRSVVLAPYRRAVVWNLTSTPRVLGVSGQSDVNDRAPLVCEWTALMRALPREALNEVRVIDRDSFTGDEAVWGTLDDRTPGLSLLWIPLKTGNETVAGVWFERWEGAAWNEGEAALMGRLGEAYSAAWSTWRRRPGLRRMIWNRRGAVVALLLIAYVMLFQEARLRVIAPCVVVPKDPHVVAAPLNGLIETVHVRPGDAIAEGDLLFSYEDDVPREELKTVREQVRLIRSRLERAQVLAFEQPEERAELEVLKHRLQKEQIRERMMAGQVEKLQVRAERGGRVVMTDPHEWQGRAVRMGDRVLSIVTPDESRLRIEIPEGDNFSFKIGIPVRVYLNVRPDEMLSAQLEYVAPYARPDGSGTPAFLAEAAWTEDADSPTLGLEGTAVLLGPPVSVGYWVIRRPLAYIRRTFGI